MKTARSWIPANGGEAVGVCFIIACLIYFFGWHEFDAVRSWLHGH
jgi:hypothetical protein